MGMAAAAAGVWMMSQVRYALSRGGRCLIADEMGTGKTLQALAAMACYREVGRATIASCLVETLWLGPER